MNQFHQNVRYAEIPDVQLIELKKLRLSNLRYDGTITSIEVIDKKNGNRQDEPFTVKFLVTTKQYGKEETSLMFKSFYIDEWDYIHETLESLNILPVSNFILRKNEAIVNLECSNRGWAHANNGIKERIKSLYDSTN